MRRLLIVPLFLISVFGLAAHPHVWIDSHSEFHFSDGRLDRVSHRWIFDQAFSQSILFDYDSNRNGTIETSENRLIEAEAFSNLRHYGYFTHLEVGGREIEITETEAFQASVENGRLVYRFEIPLDLTVAAGWQRINLGVWDETYFVEVRYDSPAAALYGAREEGVEIDLGLRENPGKKYYAGLITPEEIRLAYRRER